MINLKERIREVSNWPKKGVNFYDITTLLADKEGFKSAIDQMAKLFAGEEVDKIVGIDARGFLIAAPLAYKLKSGIAIVRKPGKLPWKTIHKKYTLEYAKSEVQMHKDAVLAGERVLIVDDLIATGGTVLAACHLTEKLGGTIVGIGAVIDLPFLGGSERIGKKYKVSSLISYEK